MFPSFDFGYHNPILLRGTSYKKDIYETKEKTRGMSN